jgi:ACR3 family arsenite efflux pump ArsB
MTVSVLPLNFSAMAASAGSSIGPVFLVLLVVAILLAIGALVRAIGVLWALTEELLHGLWSAVRGVLLLGLALVCVIFIAFTGQEAPNDPSTGLPPPATSAAH